MIKIARVSTLLMLLGAGILALSACTPQFDWREAHGADAPYVATFPAKPATHTRAINLDGMQITMTMTAAEVDGVNFAVGSAPLSDPSKAGAALQAMKFALLRNIGGAVKREKSSIIAGSPVPMIEIEALGAPGSNTRGQPRLLVARFVTKDQRIYQVLVMGPEKAVSREALDTFFASFKLS
jgi:hypothetical protein